MKRLLIKSILGCFLMGAFGCTRADNENEPKNDDTNDYPKEFILKERQDIALSNKQSVGVALQNDLSFRLISLLNKGNTSTFLISPISLAMCLSMAANGADDEVKEEILKVLLPEGGDIEALNSLNSYLSENLRNLDNSSKLSFANSVWVDAPYTILSSFSLPVSTYYTAEISNINMKTETARDAINNWVKNATESLIPRIYDENPEECLLIVNATFFKGNWTVPFDKKLSEKAEFYIPGENPTEVTYMKSGKEYFMYDITDSYSAVRLPYGNEAFSMYMVMPNEENNISTILNDLSSEKWKKMKRNMSSKNGVFVNMPIFEVEYDSDNLHNELIKCGINRLFTSNTALINSISPYPKEGSVKIRHKTVFKVNEEGAEGAALTSIGMIDMDVDPGLINSTTPPTITFDHPFLFIVEEQSTGAIIFIGVIRNL